MVLGSFLRSCHDIGVWPASNSAALESSYAVILHFIRDKIKFLTLCSSPLADDEDNLRSTFLAELKTSRDITGLNLKDYIQEST